MYEGFKSLKLKIVDKNGKVTGHINIEADYYNPNTKEDSFPSYEPEVNGPIDSEIDPTESPVDDQICLLIKDATFYKDVEGLGKGKQDPFIKWDFLGKFMKTATIKGAGKSAEWEEEHILVGIKKAKELKQNLTLIAIDENTFLNNEIGKSRPIDYNTLMIPGQFPQKITIYDNDGEVGFINIETIYNDPNNSLLNSDPILI